MPISPDIPEPLKVGATLPNGALVLATKPYARQPNGFVVLAMWNRDEFVTWASGPAGETYWGHYHLSDLLAAVVDYRGRGV
jgi:hypothetical protein